MGLGREELLDGVASINSPATVAWLLSSSVLVLGVTAGDGLIEIVGAGVEVGEGDDT